MPSPAPSPPPPTSPRGARSSPAAAGMTTRKMDTTVHTLLATPVWENATISGPSTVNPVSYAHHRVMLCELEMITEAELSKSLPSIHCQVLSASSRQTLAERYRAYTQACLKQLQFLLAQQTGNEQLLLQIVVPDQPEQAVFMGKPIQMPQWIL